MEGFRKNVSGPELSLEGTYFTQDCQIPNIPDSPVTQTAGQIDLDDGLPPEISSLQVTEIESNSVKVIWLTNEPTSAEVTYGSGSLDQSSGIISNSSQFHEITLTGLSPYTLYNYQVTSIDSSGAIVVSSIGQFLTKR